MAAHRFLVGTYTTAESGEGAQGVWAVEVDDESGAIRKLGSCGGMVNPGYLAPVTDAPGRYLAACEHFQSDGTLGIVELAADGSLRLLDQRVSPGTSNCHVAHHLGMALVISHGNGRMNVHLCRGGELGDVVHHLEYKGSSVHPRRQRKSAPHQVVQSPDGGWLYVVDLGSDVIWMHRLKSGDVTPAVMAMATPAGSGPRHMVFHPRLPFVYVVCELSNEILVARWDGGSGWLTLVDRVAGPDKPEGGIAGGAIRLCAANGMLYASYRGTGGNCIAGYQIKGDGSLTARGSFESGGLGPRDFNIEEAGRWMLVAHQHSNELTTHRLNSDGMSDGPVAACAFAEKPVCVLPV